MTNWIGRGSDEWSLEEGMGAAADIGRFSADLISHGVSELPISHVQSPVPVNLSAFTKRGVIHTTS